MAVVSLNTNVSSLQTQRRLATSTTALSKSYERLSSGLRVSRAADDAAGLAIASALKTDSRVFSQGLRNLSDGVSITNIAEGALNELTNIVTRLQELAEQSVNGTLSARQRSALDAEAQALAAEYFRIAKTTEFNGLKLFDGNTQGLSLAAGSGTLQCSLAGRMGDGTFQDSQHYSTGSNAALARIATGDLNGDGFVDIVTPNSGNVSVLFGNGDGSFQAKVDLGSGAAAVTLGDLNSDGILDIVSCGGNSVTAFLGLGDRGFASGMTFSTNGTFLASTPLDLGLADLNGDGALDVVTADSGGPGDFSILFGRGDGTFGTATRELTAVNYLSVALADINGDQFIDIVGGFNGGGSAITVALGNGDGTFKAKTNYSITGFGPTNLRLGDVNGDGRPDVVSANPSSFMVSVVLNNGDGSFGFGTPYSLGGGPYQAGAIGLGDYNGDGILDISCVGQTIAGSPVGVLIGNGNGSFGQSIRYGSGANTPRAAACADFNHDGVLDIAFADDGNARIGILLGNSRNGVAPLLDFSLKTKTDAKWALELMKQKLSQLSEQRGTIGANQSRLTTAVATLQVARENYDAAGAQIVDADVALESSTLLETQILQQAGSAVLAQANLAPSLALQLLEA